MLFWSIYVRKAIRASFFASSSVAHTYNITTYIDLCTKAYREHVNHKSRHNYKSVRSRNTAETHVYVRLTQTDFYFYFILRIIM